MAKVFIEETTLTAIGDAIRGKTGKTDLIDPAKMSTEIASIEAGSGGGEGPTDEDLHFIHNVAYLFANGNWDWVVKAYGNRITTAYLSTINNMFYNSALEEIPFQINVVDCSAPSYLFSDCTKLKVCPKVRGSFKMKTVWDFQPYSSVANCRCLRDMEEMFTPEMFDDWCKIQVTGAYSAPYAIALSNCVSLRRVPTWFYKFRLCEESTAYPSYSNCLYSRAFDGCMALDEVVDLPVWRCAGAQTSDMLYTTVSCCYRLKRFTFETNPDGSPIETRWSNQTLNCFHLGIDYTTSEWDLSASPMVTHNSGITLDTLVTDDASYQALKDDPDWWTIKPEYSRYNHDSAVETINSLPDTSAYLASAGGTNTIQFSGNAGSLTDGGAINTLTEEEIAVAAAKGWTVTFM